MFHLSTSERIARWKSFRQQINQLALPDAAFETLQFWYSCPFIPYYLSSDDPKSWPDPWQLITENYYCDLAKALGIVYTLHLSEHGPTLEPEIRVYYDPDSGYTYHVAYLCQGKYVINLIEAEVVNKEQINQRLKLKHCYTASDLKLEQY
jgi:hypothetical protein